VGCVCVYVGGCRIAYVGAGEVLSGSELSNGASQCVGVGGYGASRRWDALVTGRGQGGMTMGGGGGTKRRHTRLPGAHTLPALGQSATPRCSWRMAGTAASSVPQRKQSGDGRLAQSLTAASSGSNSRLRRRIRTPSTISRSPASGDESVGRGRRGSSCPPASACGLLWSRRGGVEVATAGEVTCAPRSRAWWRSALTSCRVLITSRKRSAYGDGGERSSASPCSSCPANSCAGLSGRNALGSLVGLRVLGRLTGSGERIATWPTRSRHSARKHCARNDVAIRSYSTKSPLQEMTRIIDFTCRFPGSRCCIELLSRIDIEGSICWELFRGRNPCLPNSSMQHRELLKWHC
jgi:hypothetical protein